MSHASQLGRSTRQLLHASISRGAGSSSRPRAARCIPGCWLVAGATADAPRRRMPGVGGRGSCSCAPGTAHGRRSPRRCSRRCRKGPSTPQSAGSHPKPLHPNAVRVMKQARHRHQREPHQAPRRVRRAALRRRDHAVRPRPRGLSRVPVAPGPRALERPRSRARGAERPGHLARVRTHRRPSSRPASGSCSICSSEPPTRRSTHAER